MALIINGHRVAEGTVSERTLRTEDLMKNFIEEIERLSTVTPNIVLEAETWLEGEEEYRVEYDYDDYEEAGSEIVNDLIKRLNGMAPKGYWFGTHPGDAADFGWWKDDDDDDEY